MTVRVHQARDHEAACRIDHLGGRGRGHQIRADGSDEPVCHQDVAHWQVTQVRVDGHDVTALYQRFLRHGLSLVHAFHGAAPAAPASKTCWRACHTLQVSGREKLMADVDLRKLRYFVALAEQLHFGRAAEALHIAQPVLSRQIRALEDELKVQLFVRDKRGTELTRAGRQLLADAGPLLASADALHRRVTRAALGQASFTIGFMPGLIVTEAVRALTSCHPQLTVNVLRTSWDDQTAVLHDGRADVSYIRLPVDQSGLRVQALLAEPRVAVFPAGHRLAGKDAISIADLADEHLLQDPGAVPEWRDIATEMRARRRRSVPVFRTVEEKLEHVAAGNGIVLLPLSTAVFYTRPDVTHSRVSDIPPNQVCLAWDAARRSRLIQDFAAIAADHPPVARAGCEF
jgi:DNA-binding transcriptional LysR family regulator